MATTKTLTPTNQTITIDAFQGEKPDHRHVADAEGKLADAVNALSSQIEYVACTTTKGSGVSAISINARKVGRVCIVSGTLDFSSSPSAWTNYDVCTITYGQTSITSTVYVVALVFSNSGKIATIEINPGENKLIFRPLGNSSYTDINGRFELVYPTN